MVWMLLFLMACFSALTVDVPEPDTPPPTEDSEMRAATGQPPDVEQPAPETAAWAWADPTPPVDVRDERESAAQLMVGCDWEGGGVELVQHVGWRGSDGFICANRLEGRRSDDCAEKVEWSATVYADGCSGWDVWSVQPPPWICVRPPAVFTSWDAGATWEAYATSTTQQIEEDV